MIKKLFLLVLLTVSSVTLSAQSIGMIGSFPASGWTSDIVMKTTDNQNYNLDSYTFLDACQVKFRQGGAWTINWGGPNFPSGVGTQDGVNIPVPAGVFKISFNKTTGQYSFQDLQIQNNEYIYFWKSGLLDLQQSIKTADLDSITFRRPDVTYICNQVWSTRNLDVTTYSDGTPIPQITDNRKWANLTTGAWCYYLNNSGQGDMLGKLYNWYAVAGIYNDASLVNPALRKKLAPTGWHIPTDIEWTTLTNCLGGANVAGGKMKEIGTSHWASPNLFATNSSGFKGFAGGYRGFYGLFGDYEIFPKKMIGIWWSSGEINSSTAWSRQLYSGNGGLGKIESNKSLGFSVRIIKD